MLDRLFARDFRNLEELSWEPGPGVQLLLGGNGAGKTSLLEAVYTVATTRSFRAARLAECCRHGRRGLTLAASVAGAARAELELVWSEEGTDRRLNGGQVAHADYLAVLPVVPWTAADLEWIAGAPAARRRLIDQGIVGLRPAALAARSRYRRALEQKRELLARGGRGLDSWNEVLAAAADELIRLRRGWVERLRAELAALLEASAMELPPIGLDYRPSPAAGGDGAERTLEAIERRRRSELERRMPLVGPHRDELEISWDDHPARRVASAGERKLLGLAITAARARLLAAAGREPLVLLDDLDAELDRTRLEGAWALFEEREQLFVASSSEEIRGPFPAAGRWRLEGGRPVAAADSPTLR